GEVHAAIGKSLARLIGVVHGAVDAVAEPELAREVHRETSCAMREVLVLDLLDERAVIIVREHAGDGMLQVEAFAEDEGRHPSGSAFRVQRSGSGSEVQVRANPESQIPNPDFIADRGFPW